MSHRPNAFSVDSHLWFRPRVVAALQPWADISERLRRYLWFRPTVVAAGLTLASALALEVKLGGIGRLKMV